MDKIKEIIKFSALKVFWFIAVFYGPKFYDMPIVILALLIAGLNEIFFTQRVSRKKYYLFGLGLTIVGAIQNQLLIAFGQISFEGSFVPFWFLSLYIVFICYYEYFDYLTKKSNISNFVLGAVSGCFSYYAGREMGSIEFNNMAFLWIGLNWGLFFLMTLKGYFMKSIIDRILDTTIVYSFNRSGFKRHQKSFNQDKFSFKENSNALVTGGTSGIGQWVTEQLAKSGVKTLITGRNVKKAQEIIKDSSISFHQLDMQEFEKIKSLIEESEPLDYLVLNAGGMPESFRMNSAGIESQMASQLFGHYYLLKGLAKAGKLKSKARVVWVTSGGMYLRKLSLDIVKKDDSYNKITTYANVKRAQVELMESFAKEFPDLDIVAMHPGWVNTPGVQSAIPDFAEKMEGKLRDSEGGGDTILWLLNSNSILESGKLYFDRRAVKKHFFWFTKTNQKDLEDLEKMMKELSPVL